MRNFRLMTHNNMKCMYRCKEIQITPVSKVESGGPPPLEIQQGLFKSIFVLNCDLLKL